MARGRARGLQGNGMLYMLAAHAITKFVQLPRKPPVTAILVALQTLIYLRPGMLDVVLPTVSQVCLNPYRIVQDWDLKRMWLSAFYHVDETHLIYNMVSLMWKCAQLESAVGSQRFAAMVAVLLGLSHGLVVALSSILSFSGFPGTASFYSNCSVGFSGVLFALKVVLNHNSSSHTNVYGILVPSRYAAWVELLAIQLFVPGTSFLGHLCGILAGVIYMNTSGASSGSLSMWSVVPTILRVISWPLRSLGLLGESTHRTYGRGTVGSRQETRSFPRESREAEVWRCQSCTYDNSALMEACEMCGTHRVIEASPEIDDVGPSAPPMPTWIPSSQMSTEELRRARLSRFLI